MGVITSSISLGEPTSNSLEDAFSLGCSAMFDARTHKIGAFQDKHHDLQPLKTNPDPMQTLRTLVSQDVTKLAALETSALPPKSGYWSRLCLPMKKRGNLQVLFGTGDGS